MQVVRMWRVVFVLVTVCSFSCLCVNQIEYEGNYADSYDNGIFKDQQEGDSSNTPCPTDSARWDKLFISLEDSSMKQNVLLESVQQCCGGTLSVRNQLEKLLQGTFQQYVPSLVSACRAQAEQAGLRLHDSLVELRREEAERERRINITLEMILQSRHGENAQLERVQEAVASQRESKSLNQIPPTPGGLGTSFSSWIKSLLSGLRKQEMTSPEDMDTLKGSLVAIVTELQRVHLQLSKVMEQTESLKKGRGDT